VMTFKVKPVRRIKSNQQRQIQMVLHRMPLLACRTTSRGLTDLRRKASKVLRNDQGREPNLGDGARSKPEFHIQRSSIRKSLHIRLLSDCGVAAQCRG